MEKAPPEAKAGLIDTLSKWQVEDRDVAEIRVPPKFTNPLLADLSPRERETLALLADGHSNKILGVKLGISEHTAKFHVMNLLKKLRVSNRAQLAAMAVRAGLA